MNAKVSEENLPLVLAQEENLPLLQEALQSYLKNPNDEKAIEALKDAAFRFGQTVENQMIIAKQEGREAFAEAVSVYVSQLNIQFVDGNAFHALSYLVDLIDKGRKNSDINRSTIINQVCSELLLASSKVPLSSEMEVMKAEWKSTSLKAETLAKKLLSDKMESLEAEKSTEGLPDAYRRIRDDLSVIEISIDTFFNRHGYLDNVQFALFLRKRLQRLQNIENELAKIQDANDVLPSLKEAVSVIKASTQNCYDNLEMQDDSTVQLIESVCALENYGKKWISSCPEEAHEVARLTSRMREKIEDFVAMPKVCRDDGKKRNKFASEVEDICRLYKSEEDQFCDEKTKKDNRSPHDENIDFWISRIIAAVKQLVRFGRALSKLGVFGLAACAISDAPGLFKFNQYQKSSRSR